MCVGGLWKQEGASGKLLSIFLSFICVGFLSTEDGPVGWGEAEEGREEEAWHIF